MNFSNVFKLSLLAVFFNSCASKVLIMQSPVVSMKRSSTEPGTSLKEGDKVDVRWCVDDKPIEKNDDGSEHYGMIDQAIWKAHKQTKADFFLDNRFYQTGNCVQMQAVAAKGGGSSGAKSDNQGESTSGDSTASEKAPTKGKKKASPKSKKAPKS